MLGAGVFLSVTCWFTQVPVPIRILFLLLECALLSASLFLPPCGRPSLTLLRTSRVRDVDRRVDIVFPSLCEHHIFPQVLDYLPSRTTVVVPFHQEHPVAGRRVWVLPVFLESFEYVLKVVVLERY